MLIVGGPGLTASMLLSKLGVESLLVSALRDGPHSIDWDAIASSTERRWVRGDRAFPVSFH